MYYIATNFENEGIDFFNDGCTTLFKKERHIRTCISNFTFIDEEEKEIKNPFENCIKIVVCKTTFYSFFYFLKEDIKRFFFNLKYNKAYYFDSIFNTKIQKFFISD